jgi:DNA polymerase-3 subunit alpha
MDHGIAIEKQVQKDLFELRKKLDLPGLATNDLHYTYAEDAKPHEVLLCVQTGKTLADPGRFKFDAQDFYLKSAAEMRAQWDPQFPEACDNTLLVADRVDVGFTEGQDLMPRAPVPEGETEESWLVKEVERGLQQLRLGRLGQNNNALHNARLALERLLKPTAIEHEEADFGIAELQVL